MPNYEYISRATIAWADEKPVIGAIVDRIDIPALPEGLWSFLHKPFSTVKTREATSQRLRRERNKEAISAWQKAYRERNKERLKAWRDEYKKTGASREADRAYRARNRERERERWRAFYAAMTPEEKAAYLQKKLEYQNANKERILAKKREYDAKNRAKNRAKLIEKGKLYREKNKDEINARRRNNRLATTVSGIARGASACEASS